jgi:photosystem II stability/assembly factor-like uncharacterized protein
MYRCMGSTTWLAAIILLTAITSQAAAPQHAQLMPLAPRSLLLDIAVAGPHLVAVGERGHILYSSDNGERWLQSRVPTTQMLTAVYFVDDQHGWAVGHDGLILLSDDGALSWRIQRDGIAIQQQANLEARERSHTELKRLRQAIQAASAGTDPNAMEALVLELEQAEMDLEDAELALEEAVFTSPLMDVWFQDEQRGWAVGAFGTLLATTDGGQSWSSHAQLIDNPDEFHLNAITGDGKGRVFIAGEAGVMYRSLDSGDSWEALEPFYEGSWFGSLYSQQDSALLVYGLRGHLYRSGNFGSDWQAVGMHNELTLSGGSVSDDGDIVLVGAVGTILHSGDGGLTFRQRMLPDRLSLSSGLVSNGELVLVGQGGIKVLAQDNGND